MGLLILIFVCAILSNCNTIGKLINVFETFTSNYRQKNPDVFLPGSLRESTFYPKTQLI